MNDDINQLAVIKSNLEIKKALLDIVEQLKKNQVVEIKGANITEIKGDIGDDGKTPEKGKDYFTDEEKNTFLKQATPKKGKDYFTDQEVDQIAKKATPVRGRDYYTEDDIKLLISSIQAQIVVPQPKPGKTPVKGVDYFTTADIQEIIESLTLPEYPTMPSLDGYAKTVEVSSLIAKQISGILKDIAKLPTTDDVSRYVRTSISAKTYALHEMEDVSIVSPTNNSVLKYNSTTQKWEVGADSGGVTGSSDNSLTISGTDAIINVAHANTWTAAQTFQNPVTINPQSTSGGLIIAPTGANSQATIQLYGRGGGGEQYTTAYVASANGTLRFGANGGFQILDGASLNTGNNIIYISGSTHVLDQYTTAGSVVNKLHPAGTSYITGGDFAIGATTASARLHVINTTEQVRTGYDTSNYYSTTVDATGIATFKAVGSGASFSFSDKTTVTDGSRTVVLANGTYAIDATAPNNGTVARFSTTYGGQPMVAVLGDPSVGAGHFTDDGGSEVALATGAYAINAVGSNRFTEGGYGDTVTILDSFDNNYGLSSVLGSGSGRTAAGHFLDYASNSVNLADGTYAINVSGNMKHNATMYDAADVASLQLSNRLLYDTAGTNNMNWYNASGIRISSALYIGSVSTAPTALLHLKAGTATAGTAPLKFTSGVSLTTALAGNVEFTTDDLFFTITTGGARKRIAFADPVGGLTSGRVPFATTNGRLTDNANVAYTLGTGLLVGDNIKLTTAGNGLYVKEGTNATMGTAVLVAGTLVVNTTKVTANSRIFLTRQIAGGTLGTSVDVTARVVGTSFTITANGSVLDTSTVAWLIVEPS